MNSWTFVTKGNVTKWDIPGSRNTGKWRWSTSHWSCLVLVPGREEESSEQPLMEMRTGGLWMASQGLQEEQVFLRTSPKLDGALLSLTSGQCGGGQMQDKKDWGTWRQSPCRCWRQTPRAPAWDETQKERWLGWVKNGDTQGGKEHSQGGRQSLDIPKTSCHLCKLHTEEKPAELENLPESHLIFFFPVFLGPLSF